MIRAIIVDDEKPALDKLSKMVQESGMVTVLATFLEPLTALEFIMNDQVDMVFLDIEMPCIDGMVLADRIISIYPDINIVFVTAFSEYAVEAFRINAIDYLLKPIENKRLLESINRIKKLSSPVQTSDMINVTCFGRFKVSVGGKEIKFRTAKAEELLACLIDCNGRSLHRNHIIDIFWSDYDGDKAVVLFNTTLYYLKKAFSFYGVQLKVEQNRGAYTLDMKKISCDAIKFTDIVSSMDAINSENINKYEEAATVYKGHYFEQNEYEWCLNKKQLLKEKYTRLILFIAEYYVRNNQNQQAAEVIIGALVYDPLNKLLNHELFKILNNKHDKVSLIKHYNIYKNRLSAEYGEEPDEELEKLV